MNTQKSIEFFGGISQLSRATKIPRQSIYEWEEKVPEKRRESVREAIKRELEEKNGLANELLNGKEDD